MSSLRHAGIENDSFPFILRQKTTKKEDKTSLSPARMKINLDGVMVLAGEPDASPLSYPLTNSLSQVPGDQRHFQVEPGPKPKRARADLCSSTLIWSRAVQGCVALQTHLGWVWRGSRVGF